MIKKNFQRTAIATAVAAAMTGGMVSTAHAVNLKAAADDSTAPTLSGAPFLGADGTKVRLTATTATAEAAVTATIRYYDATNTFISASLAVVDSDADADVVIDLSVAAPAGATQAAIIIDAAGGTGTDDIGGDDFGFVGAADGSFTPAGGAGDQAAAIAAAELGGAGLLPIDAGYTGMTITGAKLDSTVTASLIYITFSADPNIPAGALAAGTQLNTVAGLAQKDLMISNGAPGTPAAGMPGNILVAMWDDGTNLAGELLTAPPVAFDAVPTEISNAAGLSDGAGNDATAAATIAPIAQLAPPAYAGSGQVAIGLGGNADALYGAAGHQNADGALAIRVRMDLGVNALSFTDGTDDLSFSNPAGSVDAALALAELGILADADGKNTILSASITPNAGTALFVDPATGEVLIGDDGDRAGATALSVTVIDDAGNELALELNPAVIIDGDMAATPVMAGDVQAPTLTTRDFDGDGWIDGGTLDFQQDLDSLAAGHDVRLVSDASDDVTLAIDTVALSGSSLSAVDLEITTKDTPQADGTAPVGNASNDFDGDGDEDEDDAALVVEANFDTAALAPGLPFQAFVGAGDPEETTLQYARVYDAQTGLLLDVAPGAVDFSLDGANPIVQSVVYAQTDAAAPPLEAYGTVTIDTSETVFSAFPNGGNPDAINEYFFDAQTAGMLNAFATLDENVTIAIVGDLITLSNVPESVVGQVLSLGVTGGAWDNAGPNPLPGNKLITSPIPATNTVVLGADGAPVLVSVSPKDMGADGTFETLFVEFDQAVEAPAGQTEADLDGMFIVRAVVGWDEDRQQGLETHQFIIPGANVELGGAAGAGNVTLTIPGTTGLPMDTIQVWIDYEGASQAEIDAGSLAYLQNSTEAAAEVDGGALFDDALGVSQLIAATALSSVEDDDTAASAAKDAPYWLKGPGAEDNRALFTQLIKGTVKNDGVPVQANTTVRLDLVRLNETPSAGMAIRKAVVGNGYIDVRQSSNSEFERANDDNLNDWLTLALLNKAFTGSDYDAFANAVKNFQSAVAAVTSAEANNRDSKTVASLKAKQKAAEAVIATRYGNLSPTTHGEVEGYIHAYVEITNGSGKNAQDGSTSNNNADNNAMANGNASYGRTATLHKGIPNIQRDGTSYYPVRINLNWDPTDPDGVGTDIQITSLDGGFWADGVIDNGTLQAVPPRLATASSTTTQFEVIDTAFARTNADGDYRATLSMDEKSLTKTSKGLTNARDDACVLISVLNRDRDYGPNQYMLTNSCESSFTSYTPFAADILGSGAPTVRNIDMNDIAQVPLWGDGDWELIPLDGTLARTSTSNLNSGMFWLQVRPGDGYPVTIWKADGCHGDQMFTMGLGKKGGEMQLAFQLGNGADNVYVGGVNPVPGAALGFLGDKCDLYADEGAGSDQDNLYPLTMEDQSGGTHQLSLPYDGTPVSSTLEPGWHLVTLDGGSDLDTLTSDNPNIDAVILFSGRDDNCVDGAPNGGEADGCSDGNVDNTAWFAGEDASAAPFNGDVAAFIHNTVKIEGFDHGGL